MLWLNDKISLRQLQILIIINSFGTGVALLPRITAEKANQDGWILVLIATLFALLCSYIITGLCIHYPDKSFFEYTSILVTKPLAFILSFGFVIRLVLHLGFTIRLSLEVISQSMLPTTPLWIPSVLILLVSGYGASKGYETRARLAEILIFIVLVPIGLVFSIAAFNVDYSNVLPVLTTPPSTLLRGGFLTLQAFVGIELLLLAYPYVTKYKKIRGSASVSIIVLGLIMTLTTVITISRFGIYSIKGHIWPVIQMMDSTNLPGSFIQRQGMLVMSFFIISVFAIVNACLFFSSLLIKSVVKKGNHSYYVVICMILGLFVSILPQNLIEVYRYMELSFLTFGLAYMLFIPIILFVLAKVRHGFVKKPRRATALLLVVLPCLLFVGCDKRELEERVFVMSMGIDKFNDKPTTSDDKVYRISGIDPLITLTLTSADLTNDEGLSKETMISDERNIYSAISQLDLNTNRDVYLGLTQTVVLGKDLIADSTLLRNTIDMLNRNRELSKDSLLLISQDGVIETLTAETKENKLGPAQPKFRKKDASFLDQIKTQSIENVSKALNRTGGTLIPVISINNGYVNLESLAIIKGYEHVGYLHKENIPGYLLGMGDGVGLSISTETPESTVPFHLSKVKRHLTYTHINETIVLNLNLKVQGTVEAYNLTNLFDDEKKMAELKYQYQQILEDKINQTYYLLEPLEIDLFEFEETLRKTNHKLYQLYLEKHLPLKLNVSAEVVIESIGAIK